MSSVGDQIRMDWLIDSLKGKDISNLIIIFGTCKDCKHRDPEDKMCDSGHSIVWQTPRPDDWYCADFVKRGNENG